MNADDGGSKKRKPTKAVSNQQSINQTKKAPLIAAPFALSPVCVDTVAKLKEVSGALDCALDCDAHVAQRPSAVRF
jgi:hypothetical protein